MKLFFSRKAAVRRYTGNMNGLEHLPATRRSLLGHMKRRGEARADALAAQAGITVQATRQHLTALERDGLVTHSVERKGPGRPTHLYALTAAGDALFPRAYAELTNELLDYVEKEDPALLQRIFDRRADRRLAAARERTRNASFGTKVKEVAAILDEDGYLADFEERPDGTYLIREHNCAVLSVAQRYGHACSSELAFLRAAMPEAEVTRIAHRLAGGHVCAYRIALRDPCTSPPT